MPRPAHPDAGMRCPSPLRAEQPPVVTEDQTLPEEPALSDTLELVMRFHPVGGEDVSILSRDFTDEAQALEMIARAVDERRGLVLAHARYNREAGESGMVVNLANVVSVRVSTTDSDSDTTGQYL